MSQEEPGGARRSQQEPAGARRSQEEPGGAERFVFLHLYPSRPIQLVRIAEHHLTMDEYLAP